MLTLGEVLADIRGAHPAFDRTRVPDPVLARALERYQAMLLGKAVFRDKSLLARTVTLSQPATVDQTVALAGLPLLIYALLGGELVLTNGDREALEWVTVGRRLETTRTVTVLDGQLYENGSNNDWNDVASLEILYTPLPTPLSALPSLFTLPDLARDCLAAYGAKKAAQRVKGLGVRDIDAAWFDREATDAETTYLSSLRLSQRARVTTVREGDY